MEGVSDFAFRLWLAATSAPPTAGTPFLRVTASYPGSVPEGYAPELGELQTQALSYRLLPQLMATSAEDFIRVAKPLLKRTPVIELNCGCPAPKSVGSGAGSSLLQNPTAFGRFVRQCVAALGDGRLSVKMRTGFASADEFPDLLAQLKDVPINQLVIHGRSREQRYSGLANWELIQAASEELAVPVIGSGDIVSLTSLQARAPFAQNLRGVIVGRGALRNPWIFTELNQRKTTQTLPIQTLMPCLFSYALLVELDRHARPQLEQLVAEGWFRTPSGTSPERWQALFARLFETRFGFQGQPPYQAMDTLDRSILGRLKLVWNYLRSSLPQDYFAPTLLRSQSFSQFHQRLMELNEKQSGETLILQHQPHYDWLYSSDKKQTRQEAQQMVP